MVSAFMPDVVVEIAFDSNFATPAISRTWTDVSTYVELHDDIDINFGRQDENATADANDLTLTLDNSDGRFTALRSASPYFPNVKIGRPVRVTATPPGGSASTRFVGFIDEWPVEWDGTDSYAKTTVRATSRLSRLGLTARLRSGIEQEILSDGPTLYYTMGDASGSTSASESSGNSGSPLTLDGTGAGTVTFGEATGPGTDGLTAVSFAVSGAHRYLGTTMPASTSSTTFGVGCFFSTPNPALAAGQLIIGYPTDDPIGSSLGLITMDAAGKIVAGLAPATTVTSANSYDDGNVHHVFITSTGGTLTLYLDGVSVGSAGGVAAATLTRLRVGQQLNGSLSHVEVYGGPSPTLPSAARIATHADAGLTGIAGDTTDERLLRLLGYAGVPSTEVDAETGVETMTYQLTSGGSVVDALRDVESTEGGVLFDGPDGQVKFHNRSHRYLQAPAVTLNMAAQHVEADYAPKLDRSTLVNDVTVDNPTTGEEARLVDTASQDEYGVATSSATSVADSSAALAEKASWLLASYAEPRMRCPSLTVDVLAHQGLTPSAADLLNLTVGDVLAVENAPTQSDTTSPSYFVEGYTETIGPESWFITFNLSPTYPASDVFILDDPDRGVLDTSILAY